MNPEDAQTLVAGPPEHPELVDNVDQLADAFLVAPGESIGRYVVRDQLGEGGMGVVYVADDPNLGRQVAIKLLRPVEGSDAPEHQRRLLREAQAMARLSHPNLVAVHDVGAHEGRIWVAMEYLRGCTLDEWLDREQRTIPQVARVFLEAGRGLLAAHEAGLVHRDFKPTNVIVRDDGRVQVLDFGLVRAEGEADEGGNGSQVVDDTLAADLTRTGGIMGTPAYMAPEQHLALPTDARADQFSFCVALYESLYGQRPFQGDDASAIMKAVVDGVRRAPPEMDGLPDVLRGALAKGLAKQANRRHDSMAPLLDALREVAGDSTPAAQPRASGPSRSTRRAALLGLGTAGVLAVGVWAVAKLGVPSDQAKLAPANAAEMATGETGGTESGGTETEDVEEPAQAGNPDDSGLPSVHDGHEEGTAQPDVGEDGPEIDPGLPAPDPDDPDELPGVIEPDDPQREIGETGETGALGETAGGDALQAPLVEGASEPTGAPAEPAD